MFEVVYKKETRATLALSFFSVLSLLFYFTTIVVATPFTIFVNAVKKWFCIFQLGPEVLTVLLSISLLMTLDFLHSQHLVNLLGSLAEGREGNFQTQLLSTFKLLASVRHILFYLNILKSIRRTVNKEQSLRG